MSYNIEFLLYHQSAQEAFSTDILFLLSRRLRAAALYAGFLSKVFSALIDYFLAYA